VVSAGGVVVVLAAAVAVAGAKSRA